MPFTLSHPAAAIPFARWRLAISPLIIGSIAPDFQHFIRFTGQDRELHDFPGVLLFTLPIAFVCLAVFQVVLKRPAISLLPDGLHRRVCQIEEFRWMPFRRMAQLIVSLCVGIGSHIAWDSFTHDDGWFIVVWPKLTIPLFYVRGTALPAYKIAQHASTGVGLVVLFFYFFRWYKKSGSNSAPKFAQFPFALRTLVLSLILGFVSVCGIIGAWRLASKSQGLPFLAHVTSGFAVAASSALAAAMLIYSAVWWTRELVRPRSSRDSLDAGDVSSF